MNYFAKNSDQMDLVEEEVLVNTIRKSVEEELKEKNNPFLKRMEEELPKKIKEKLNLDKEPKIELGNTYFISYKDLKKLEETGIIKKPEIESDQMKTKVKNYWACLVCYTLVLVLLCVLDLIFLWVGWETTITPIDKISRQIFAIFIAVLNIELEEV